MRGPNVTKRLAARTFLLATLVAASIAVAAPSSTAAVSKLPAAGQLAWPSVAVRANPSASARRKMTLRELRSDYRPQIVLAVGMRRVGFRAGQKSAVTLRNTSGMPALALAARDEGDDGNALHVGIQDSATAGEDIFVIYQHGSELLRFGFSETNVSGLAAVLNGFRTPVVASAVVADGVPLTQGTTGLSGGQNGNPGRVWYKLNLPVRPFGQTGWVPEDSVDVRTTKKRVVVDRSARRVTVYQGARRIFSARVAVGRPDRKTPLGSFYVAAKYVPPMNALVSGYALELSAPAGLPDFLKGGVVGIHGTPATWSIGKSASNGCVRVTNATVYRLRSIVPLGTPVRVVR